MFRLTLIFITIILVALLSKCQTNSQAQQQVLEAEAREITQRFVGTLLPTLQQALTEGGPAHAIEVCSEQAPAIARSLSNETGWQVSRVSLKARNRASATPDSWEREILNQFDQRQRDGEPGPQINASAIIDNEYRFMQAQPVMPLCLNCHGTSLAEEVSNALQQYYPDDLATGYNAGEIRGAISLVRPL